MQITILFNFIHCIFVMYTNLTLNVNLLDPSLYEILTMVRAVYVDFSCGHASLHMCMDMQTVKQAMTSYMHVYLFTIQAGRHLCDVYNNYLTISELYNSGTS